jgi:hypothetical protein
VGCGIIMHEVTAHFSSSLDSLKNGVGINQTYQQELIVYLKTWCAIILHLLIACLELHELHKDV